MKNGFSDRDINKFIKALERAEKASVREIQKQVIKSAQELMEVTLPMTPIKSGALKDSGEVRLNDENGKLIGTVSNGNLSVNVTSGDLEPKGDIIGTAVIFRKVYAPYQHRGKRFDGTHVIRRYSSPNAKKFFLKRNIEAVGKKMIKSIKLKAK